MTDKKPPERKKLTKRQAIAVIRALNDNFLRCRDIGHQWRLFYQKREGRFVVRKMYCPSCKTNRKTKIDAYGSIASNSYDYDRGYVIQGLGDLQSVARAMMRVEAINRMPELDIDREEVVA